MYDDLSPHPITVAGLRMNNGRSSLHRNLAARRPFFIALSSTSAESNFRGGGQATSSSM